MANQSQVKCYSVRLQSVREISEKAIKVTDFNGNEAIIPKSQYFGIDYDVVKSEAHWISAWILGQKNITYSTKKESFFDKEKAYYQPETGITVERSIPEPVQPVENNEIPELKRESTRQFVIVSPCYRANGFHGRYISYAETDQEGNFTFILGDHYWQQPTVGIQEQTNIFKCEGVDFSDEGRPISIIEVSFDATQVKDNATEYLERCSQLLNICDSHRIENK